MDSARFLVAARLMSIHAQSADIPEDVITTIWDYLPLVVYPNSFYLKEQYTLPGHMLAYDCESNLNLKTGEFIGRMVSSTFIGPARVRLPVTPSCGSEKFGRSPTNMSSSHAVGSIGDGHAGCVLGNCFYYYFYKNPNKLYRISFKQPPHMRSVIKVPEPVADLRVVDDVLFITGAASSRIFMMVGAQCEFKYVMTMTSQDPTDSASEGDEDDPDWFPSPKFQDALIEDGRPITIMFTKGGTWGKICVWQASGGIFETPERNVIMCRFFPRTGGNICFGTFANRYGESGYVYHIYEDLILSPNLFAEDGSAASLYVDDDWNVCVSSLGIGVDPEFGLGLVGFGLNIFQFYHQVSATKFRDGRLLARKSMQS
ncbi:hypothetical protein FOZ60_014460 [Perkinsus olseni]|uniref:Uncharacterized protein n=2 Tax=Perkinsus olseni TaxID=32597 RepID=A0A7J6N8J0_PEROL|nr:hypothetical protein FOZ60_014460 [Perkinsus olseni]